jgi:hypothetical protein
MTEQSITNNRDFYKRQLKYGDLPKIAELSGVEYRTAYRWFRHESNNPAVAQAVKLFFENRKSKMVQKIADLS